MCYSWWYRLVFLVHEGLSEHIVHSEYSGRKEGTSPVEIVPATVYTHTYTVHPHSCLPVHSAKMDQNALPIPGRRYCETTPVTHVVGLWPLPADACTQRMALVSACVQFTSKVCLHVLPFL